MEIKIRWFLFWFIWLNMLSSLLIFFLCLYKCCGIWNWLGIFCWFNLNGLIFFVLESASRQCFRLFWMPWALWYWFFVILVNNFIIILDIGNGISGLIFIGGVGCFVIWLWNYLIVFDILNRWWLVSSLYSVVFME